MPETVYGGKVDWTTGKLIANYAKTAIDSFSYVQETYDGGIVVHKTVTGRKHGTGNIYAEMFTNNVYTKHEPYTMYGNIAYHNVYFCFPFETLEAVNAWAAENPIELVYELAAPQEIALTPQQLDMLKGANNVWGDGTTDLVYAADTKLYIDGKFDALQNAILAQGANI